MSEEFKRIKGFADIFGKQARIFTAMEYSARQVFSAYAFEELRTPVLERTELFQRSIGSETDVVQKEMFTFPDRKGRSLTLRPEATAGVMRACIEAGLAKPGIVSRFYTIGPMFRYERPQKGRMRQFHQINCEFLGSSSPFADAELIRMLLDFLASVKLAGLKLKLNSLGCRNCRPAYLEALHVFLDSLPREDFCDDCRRRIDSNPLRVLDCKNAECGRLTRDAPRFLEHVCGECRGHHERLMELLLAENVDVEIDHRLVRGLDYYSRTTFEVVSGAIGAQTAVAGGGRYDGLISQLGGGDIPGAGFACGMERLALLMEPEAGGGLDFYLLCLENAALKDSFILAEKLRRAGFRGEMNHESGSFKSLMRQASKSGARFCLILGPDEIMAGEIAIKDMGSGMQRSVSRLELETEPGHCLGRE